MSKFFILLSVLLVGCASTGVVPTGSGAYMVAKSGGGLGATGAEVSADLYREADAFCANQNKVFVKVSVDEKDWKAFVRGASAKLEFRCADKSEGNTK